MIKSDPLTVVSLAASSRSWQCRADFGTPGRSGGGYHRAGSGHRKDGPSRWPSRRMASATGTESYQRMLTGGWMTAIAQTEQSDAQSNRWVQLVLGLIAMMAISSPQYVWTLFTGPLNQKLGTTLAEIQVTFSLLIVLQTFFSPFQAYLVDRFGPKLLISVGAIMSGGSWVLASSADSLRPSTSPTASSAALERGSSMWVSSAWSCAGSLTGAAWRRVSRRLATASAPSSPAFLSTA